MLISFALGYFCSCGSRSRGTGMNYNSMNLPAGMFQSVVLVPHHAQHVSKSHSPAKNGIDSTNDSDTAVQNASLKEIKTIPCRQELKVEKVFKFIFTSIRIGSYT